MLIFLLGRKRAVPFFEAGLTIHAVQDTPAKPVRHGDPEALVSTAAAALRDLGPQALRDFDEFPAPLYAVDGTGRIVYFNPASIAFSGRIPTLHVDRWCVSWKLFASDGGALTHDQCPMAVAIRKGRPVRNVEAFAERPDGARTRFRPFPTPVADEAGRVIGAVNLLVPVDGIICRDLLARAEKWRGLAKWMTDKQAKDALTAMARECEHQAAALRLN